MRRRRKREALFSAVAPQQHQYQDHTILNDVDDVPSSLRRRVRRNDDDDDDDEDDDDGLSLGPEDVRGVGKNGKGTNLHSLNLNASRPTGARGTRPENGSILT